MSRTGGPPPSSTPIPRACRDRLTIWTATTLFEFAHLTDRIGLMPASGNNKFELRFMSFRVSELTFQFRFEVAFAARRAAAFEFFQMSRFIGDLLVHVCNIAERAHCRCPA
jgi:hypothetical protein